MYYRLALACSFAFNAILFCSPTFADDIHWPDRPIHIIVPLPAGSAADTVARLIGTGLSAKLGQPVIINDQAGASGEIGTTQVAKADPDGYTFGIATTTTLVTAPILSRHLRYRLSQGFCPGCHDRLLAVRPGCLSGSACEDRQRLYRPGEIKARTSVIFFCR